MVPLVFIDVETTGLDPQTCSIIQLSGIIKSDNRETSFDFRIAPYKGEKISEAAKEKTGLTDEIIQTYPPYFRVYKDFLQLLDDCGVGTSYTKKAFFVGYNSDFDMRFLRSFFEFNNDMKFGYRFWWPDLDVARLAALYLMPQRREIKGFKLVDVYQYLLGKPLENAHNAMADIAATKELFEYLCIKMLFEPRASLDAAAKTDATLTTTSTEGDEYTIINANS